MKDSDFAAVIERHAERLMAVPGVVGVAQGRRRGIPCVVVMVSRKTAELIADIPVVIEGIPTDILETGAPEAFER
jgi:hypothetical protein